MAEYRVLNPTGDVVDQKDFDNADDAYAWFRDTKAANDDLGWRIEVNQDGSWAFFDDSEGGSVSGGGGAVPGGPTS
ncbi:hypothetical protein [Williamsia sterculiae]|uniref:Uncharacterized protein n=1 Tax=Williamsia sterculiae TaxID=1344003 RepID=A0A1N7HBL0_9NOCA|nr:hypothetical protein [Williamsia sterculiae]SIS22068.1 hypothetical protein SAMN05445060_3885 [Williamsia sterculiae]